MAEEQLPLPLGHFNAQQFEPVSSAVEGAAAYARQRGLTHSIAGLESLQNVHQRGAMIAQAYQRSQAANMEQPGIRRSYGAMRDEVNAQYEHMTRPIEQGGMGFTHSVHEAEPYGFAGAGGNDKTAAQRMAEDIRNRHVKTLATSSTGPHNFFSDAENDRFRAVHDVFGHGATGRGFSRHGEEAAFRSHAQMFTPQARGALASETRGQNSYLNYGPGSFPEQGTRLVGLPDWAERVSGQFNDRRAGQGVFTATGQPARR